MAYSILEMLDECEALVKEGRQVTFVVLLEEDELLVKLNGEPIPKVAPLSDELKVSLQIFFDDSPSISYRSSDYTTLKSLIRAQACINRMKSKEQ